MSRRKNVALGAAGAATATAAFVLGGTTVVVPLALAGTLKAAELAAPMAVMKFVKHPVGRVVAAASVGLAVEELRKHGAEMSLRAKNGYHESKNRAMSRILEAHAR